jgi:hypothetical protein
VLRGAFSPDGKRAVTASDSIVYRCDFASEQRPARDLAELTLLLTGQQLHATSSDLVPVSLEVLMDAWQRLRLKYPGEFASRRADALAWHRREAETSEQFGQAFAISFHLRYAEATRSQIASDSGGDVGQTHFGRLTQVAPQKFDHAALIRSRISPPDFQASPDQIDLSDYYTDTLTEGQIDTLLEEYVGSEWNNLSSLPRGLQTLAGVTFDIRGSIQLAGAYTTSLPGILPERVGIKVGRTCRRLHFLLSNLFSEPFGTEIGRLTVRYSDGVDQAISVRYGPDVRDMWLRPDEPPETPGAVAWAGTNAMTAETGITFRLYKKSWENPYPEKEIQTVDFASTLTACAPY